MKKTNNSDNKNNEMVLLRVFSETILLNKALDESITVKDLKEFIKNIPDDTKVILDLFEHYGIIDKEHSIVKRIVL